MCASELLFPFERERGRCRQASDGDGEGEMVSSTLPGLTDCGKSKEAATIKGSVNAVYTERCNRALGSVSLSYLDLGHSTPLDLQLTVMDPWHKHRR